MHAGQCAGLVSGRYAPTPLASHVHLNFTAGVVVVRGRDVISAFEQAISAFSRPVDPSIETGSQQVWEVPCDCTTATERFMPCHALSSLLPRGFITDRAGALASACTRCARITHASGRPPHTCIRVRRGPAWLPGLQVDAVKLEAFVDHFIDSLGLQSTYSLLLLSPEWHADEPVYGYRAGLSRCAVASTASLAGHTASPQLHTIPTLHHHRRAACFI